MVVKHLINLVGHDFQKIPVSNRYCFVTLFQISVACWCANAAVGYPCNLCYIAS